MHIWENMQKPGVWGSGSPIRMPGKQNPRSGFCVTQANLAPEASMIAFVEK